MDDLKESANAVHPVPGDDDSIVVDVGSFSNATHHVSLGSTEENKKETPKMLSNVFYITHLAVFGILGVFARYLLQKLFSPSAAAITSHTSPLYPDLPSNMVGSFLMGWMGIVFKEELSNISEYVPVGLTTGFLGSLTTFSAWMQEMIGLSAKGHWVDAAVELLLGVMLMISSIFLGVRSAKGLKCVLRRKGYLKSARWKINSLQKHTIAFFVMLCVLIFLWALSGELLRLRFKAKLTSAELWLACLVGPFGVWLRWWLGRQFNNQGIGSNQRFKWVPFGTLAANILAATLMAALATIKLAVKTRQCDIVVTGIQMGFLGCLSTVSTFAAEIYSLTQGDHPWRAELYTALTIVPSLILGTLNYSLPVWIKHYS